MTHESLRSRIAKAFTSNRLENATENISLLPKDGPGKVWTMGSLSLLAAGSFLVGGRQPAYLGSIDTSIVQYVTTSMDERLTPDGLGVIVREQEIETYPLRCAVFADHLEVGVKLASFPPTYVPLKAIRGDLPGNFEQAAYDACDRAFSASPVFTRGE